MSVGSTLAQIDFSDQQQCLALVASLPANAHLVRDKLEGLLAGMQANPPPPLRFLEVLEVARGSLAFAQEEAAKRHAGRPVPPGSAEDASLGRTVALWQTMARAYAQAARLGSEDPAIRDYLALICQRCIHYSGRALFEYFRLRRVPPAGLWSDLHGYFASAEEWGIAGVSVGEPLDEYRRHQCCADAYAAVLLTDLANPCGRTQRELGWLWHWAQRFAAFVEVSAVAADTDANAYVVDLEHDCGPAPLHRLHPRPSLRRLATQRLAGEMHDVLAGLKAGKPPSDLGLGADCSQPQCNRLLIALYRPWCLTASPRRFQRRSASGSAALHQGFEAMHHAVCGSEFVQPQHVRVYSRDEWESITTFRFQVDPTAPLHVRDAQYARAGDPWEVVDQSVAGFRLKRDAEGASVQHGQLVGLRPPDGERTLLCQITWLRWETDGSVGIGVHVLPGMPQAIAARAVGPQVSPSEQYARAFVLPAMPALKEAASLVLPYGWFHPERVIELYTDRREEVRLIALLGQGPDFDRASYAIVKNPALQPEAPGAPGRSR